VQPSVADYEIIRPWPSADGGARYLARAPSRLGLAPETVVAVEAVPGDPRGWAGVVERLGRIAAVRSTSLVQLIEALPADGVEGMAGFHISRPGGDGSLADAPPSRRRDLAIQAVEVAARAAHDLHEAGLVHGRIRPDALVSAGDELRLGVPGSVSEPEPGLVVAARSGGDLELIDPELLRGEPPNRSTDVWALGVTLHRLLSDRPLFAGINDDDPVTAVQRVLFTRPQLDEDLPSQVAGVIRWCLAANPSDRPPSAAHIAASLSEIRS
jgi:hypothetical protein